MEPTEKQLDYLSSLSWRLAYLERDIRRAKGEQTNMGMVTDTDIVEREAKLTNTDIDDIYMEASIISIFIDGLKAKVETAEKELEGTGNWCKTHRGVLTQKCNNGGCDE